MYACACCMCVSGWGAAGAHLHLLHPLVTTPTRLNKHTYHLTNLYFLKCAGILDKLADKYGFVKGASYHNVSMGQGQVRQASSDIFVCAV